MLFTIERRQSDPRGQEVSSVGRDTTRHCLDGIDPGPATTVDGFDPLIVCPNPREQARKFTGKGRVALPQLLLALTRASRSASSPARAG
jgi:hypothetical protein